VLHVPPFRNGFGNDTDWHFFQAVDIHSTIPDAAALLVLPLRVDIRLSLLSQASQCLWARWWNGLLIDT
jgi:hypothetical protein